MICHIIPFLYKTITTAAAAGIAIIITYTKVTRKIGDIRPVLN
jgi:hypothetical protein